MPATPLMVMDLIMAADSLEIVRDKVSPETVAELGKKRLADEASVVPVLYSLKPTVADLTV